MIWKPKLGQRRHHRSPKVARAQEGQRQKHGDTIGGERVGDFDFLLWFVAFAWVVCTVAIWLVSEEEE